MKMYKVSSVKTGTEHVRGRDAAIKRARELRDEYQPAFGVTVERDDGTVIYTAR